MSQAKMMLFGLVFLSSFHGHAADTLGNELRCYRALINHADGPDFDLGNDTVLTPGSKGSSRGFYIYTDQTAYFCEFPKGPTESNTHFNHYNFKLDIPKKRAVYMTYSESKSNPFKPELVIISSPAKSSIEKYVVPKCGAYLTDESRAVLTSELKARIATVKSAFDSEAIYVQLRFGQREQPDKYKDALNTCMTVGGEVSTLANTELAKFPTAAPTGPTGDRRPVN